MAGAHHVARSLSNGTDNVSRIWSPTMLASIPSATLHGVDGRPVSVEVHVSAGLPGFTVVGLPDAAVRESRDRVRAALLSSYLSWPSRSVTVNLAPSRYRFGKLTSARMRRTTTLPSLSTQPWPTGLLPG